MAKNKNRKTAENQNDTILESISDGVFTVDLNWQITSFNRAAVEITGISRTEAVGRLCSEVFKSSMCENECALRKTLDSGKQIISKSGYIITADGTRKPVSVSTAVLRDKQGDVIGGAETFRDLTEVEALRRELSGKHSIGDLVSYSPAMRTVMDLVPAVSSSSSCVLIQGETGTGKEVFARAIHNLSSRSELPFIAINCGALPDTLLESELFGYKKGAFTGADTDKPGRFALARGGTLLLDEIGEMSPALQVRLLRVLQENSYEPLGSTKSEVTSARIISATNRRLGDLVRQGEFREDLFYRVSVIVLELPPLRGRKEDIPQLVEHFITRFNRIQQREISGVTPEVLAVLMAHNWPGNIRELENVIERAFVLCGQKRISLVHLPPELLGRKTPDLRSGKISSATSLAEEQSILCALEHNNYNRAAAARVLGIHKTTLYRKMKSLGIPLPDRSGRSSS